MKRNNESRVKTQDEDKTRIQGTKGEWLSTQASKILTDPLTILDSTEFVEVKAKAVPRKETFRISYHQFVNLVERTFTAIADSNITFRKTIPLVLYSYYCTQHFWARIAALNTHRPDRNRDATRLLAEFANKQFPIPMF